MVNIVSVQIADAGNTRNPQEPSQLTADSLRLILKAWLSLYINTEHFTIVRVMGKKFNKKVLEHHPGRMNPSHIPGSRGTKFILGNWGTETSSLWAGEPYPALRFASSEFGWAGNSPAPMYNFRKVPQFPRIIFVEGSPASQPIAGEASISRSTARGVGR